jgi:hypothetical protein
MNTLKKLLPAILLFSCTASENKDEPQKENSQSKIERTDSVSIEEKCISLIDTLAEVVLLATKIELTTKNHNYLSIWVAAKPSETKIKYYWVKVGEDNGDNIVTHLNFYVDPKSEEVLFYDIMKDTLMSLEYWRILDTNKN